MKNIHYFHLISLLIFTCFSICIAQNNPNLTSNANEKLKYISSESKNLGNNVHASLQDKKGNLWFATTAGGVFRFNGKTFTNYSTKNGLNTNGIFAIYEDKKGIIYLGTDKGLSIFDGNKFANLLIKPNNLNSQFLDLKSSNIFVNSIFEDKGGKIWIGAEQGIFMYQNNKFTRFSDLTQLQNPNKFDPKLVLVMVQAKNGDIWISTRNEGIYKVDGKVITNFKPTKDAWFRGIHEDKNGNIWIGTRYNGVIKYDGKNFNKITENIAFGNCTINQIMQDTKGNIWFATEGPEDSKDDSQGGLWRYDGTSFTNVTKNKKLKNHAIWCVLEDKDGNIWIGTRNTDLYKYNGNGFVKYSK